MASASTEPGSSGFGRGLVGGGNVLQQALRSTVALAAVAVFAAAFGDVATRGLSGFMTVWAALPVAARAWRGLRRKGRPNIDFLDSVAIAVAIGVGDFLTASMVAFLVTLGESIRDRTAANGRRALQGLVAPAATAAWRRRGAAVERCEIADLAVGDEVIVDAGEIAPADGEVLEGEATVDLCGFSGESGLAALGPGAKAWATTPVVEGRLRMRVTATGDDTAAAAVARLVENAPVGDTRIQSYAEHFADRLVAPTLALAIAVVLWTGDHRYLLSVLVVDFGTGVRVSAPLAVLSSMIAAARRGLVIKSGSQIERLAALDTVVFDKTGTLTIGKPAIEEIVSYDPDLSREDLLGLAAAVERRSGHPFAEAIRARAEALGLRLQDCEDVETSIARGVSGRIGGARVRLGNARYLSDHGVDLTASAADLARIEAGGGSVNFLARDEKLVGAISVRDQIRPEAAAIVAKLRMLGVRRLVLLSGDHEAAARAVAETLGLDRYFGSATPGEKVAVVQALQRDGGAVAMVGDGLNDGPALSYADVGVALNSGSELARNSAGVVLGQDSLLGLVEAIEISRECLKRIRRGYAIVALWNVQALVFALVGVIGSPAMTALVSDGSALFAGAYGMAPLLAGAVRRRPAPRRTLGPAARF